MKIGKNHIYLGKRPDKLAKEGAEKEIPEPIDIQILTDFNVQGVKLATINQVIAYKGILKKRCRPLRQEMERNLEMTRATVTEITNSQETDTVIWYEDTSEKHQKNLTGLACLFT